MTGGNFPGKEGHQVTHRLRGNSTSLSTSPSSSSDDTPRLCSQKEEKCTSESDQSIERGTLGHMNRSQRSTCLRVIAALYRIAEGVRC